MEQGSDEEEDEEGSDMSDSDCVIRGEDMIVSLSLFSYFRFSTTQRVASETGWSLAERNTASTLKTKNCASLETISDPLMTMALDPSESMNLKIHLLLLA